VRKFQCANHKCIPRYQACDGLDNCGDGSDENNMTLCSSRAKPCNLYAEYQCANRKCVDKTKVCDFADDCGDASDELGCRKFYSPYIINYHFNFNDTQTVFKLIIILVQISCIIKNNNHLHIFN
jgi:Low-density lipoprotein receptor domain class A